MVSERVSVGGSSVVWYGKDEFGDLILLGRDGRMGNHRTAACVTYPKICTTHFIGYYLGVSWRQGASESLDGLKACQPCKVSI